jgi:serine/threonine-protein kinase
MFLVQDYAEGPTYQDILRDRARQNQAFGESEVVTLLLQLLPVLSYIHGRGVIHRDLSPDNLICRNSDRLPVLIDFGGVKEVTAGASSKVHRRTSADTPKNSVTLIGKPGYSPEEQMRRGQVSAASDLYALGVTALVLLIGKDPAEFYDAFHLTFDWHDKVNVSQGLAAILDKMVAHRVANRYTNTQQVLQDLGALVSQKQQPDWVAAPQQHWTAPPSASPSAPQTVGSFKTQVVAPLGTAVATAVAAASPSIERSASAPIAGAAQGLSGWIWRQITVLGKSFLVLVLLLGAGALGWVVVRGWLQSQFPQPSSSAPSTAVSSASAEQNQAYSASERQRKAQLISRLERLGVSSNFFYRLVNEAYFLQYPDQRGRLLGNGSEDEGLRANWDQVGSQVLDAIEPLRPAARDRLGSYTEGDRASWVTQLGAAGQDSDRFFGQVESQLTDALPMYRGVDLGGKPAALQLSSGIAADRMVEAGQNQ